MNPERIAFGRQIFDYFTKQGLPPHQAAAIAGNMAWEGGGRADLVNPGDNWKNSPNSPHSVGIGQWNDRAPALLAFARSQGLDIPQGDLRDQRYMQDAIRRIPLETQLGFAWNEMHGPERRAYQSISQGGDLRTAARGAISYHRPAGWTWGNPERGHAFDQRVALGERIMGTPSVPSGPQAPKVTFESEPQVPQAAPAPAPTLAKAQPPTQTPPDMQSAIMQAIFKRGEQPEQQKTASAFPTPSAIPQAQDPRRPVDLTRLLEIVNNRQKLGV